MKHLILALLFLGVKAQAYPYLRPIDISHPVKIVGFYVDPLAPGQTSLGTAVALITHSTKDGCLLPSVICEDWAPLTTGFSVNAGKLLWNIGPVANIAPWVQTGLSKLPHMGWIAPDPQAATSISFGPQLNVNPVAHGVVLPVNQWAPRFIVFTGGIMHF